MRSVPDWGCANRYAASNGIGMKKRSEEMNIFRILDEELGGRAENRIYGGVLDNFAESSSTDRGRGRTSS